MAEIVSNLFGIDPAALQQQRAATDTAQAFRFAQLDPLQRANMAIYQGSAGIGRGITQLMGGDEQLNRATQVRQLASQFDMTNPEGIEQFAQAVSPFAPEVAQVAVQRANQLRTSASQLQTGELTTSGGQLGLLRKGPGTITPVKILQPDQAPAAPAPAPAAAPQIGTATKGVTSADMVAPRNDPGFALPYQVRRAGDIRPFAPGEEAATVEGQAYIKNLSTVGSTAPMALDRVDRVMQTIAKIESSRDFQAGKPGELEGRLRAAFGDADYKLLEKELADLTIATNQAIGGKTDASTALVAQSMGNTSFPPGTLRNIATKLRGDAYGAMLEAKGANKFLQLGLNEANLPRGYKAAWDENKDVRVYEAMAIFASDRLSPKEKMEAYNKIKPTDLESLIEFERKARNIESLANTGTLPRQKR